MSSQTPSIEQFNERTRDVFRTIVENYLDTAYTQMQEYDFRAFDTSLKAVVDAHKDKELMALAKTAADDIEALQSAAETAFGSVIS